MCEDLLISYLEDYMDMEKGIPEPNEIQEGQYAIPLSSLMVAKVLLHNEMLSQNISKAQLARLMNTSPAEVQRITNLRYGTKIDTLAKAFQALGKCLILSVI